MKNNFDKESNLYRFIKVNGLDKITKIKVSDVSKNIYLNQEQVDNLKHIKENLYEFNGDFLIPENYS
ncbi:hypothetical protein LX77_03865 [Gelidibacter algens]|uniref:Uncharacterized protein n=1 Tax=Gelidibacter algens TaxID=49280 RepID=A0A327RKW6_9FLAO|nr:hypothetical protein [Gelidibacter algens]RAJ17539.1 hypothetical protein LX77_03865 [Gelidibacter algens]